MKKQQKRHRIIATFFLLIFFPTLVPTNMFASNNGPKSPEAASFEPVDATDMVNLLTGQYSYVLPLLNVPSPEGGYPLALGYHAGIALDQEASWTGLGWNVNPGAIDRSINGYPDDYSASHLNEYFYDSGGEQYASFVSVGYSCGVASVGLGFNWGSNQALGGFVSVGVGYDIGGGNKVGVNATIGTNGSSIGVGAEFAGGLSVGVNASSDGTVGASVGFSSNGAGFQIGYDSSGSITSSTTVRSIGISMSTSDSGTHVTVKAGGVGYSTSFNNTLSMGDYATSSNDWSIPITVPTPIGIFSLSFGKQTFKYWLATNKENFVTGSLYYQDGVSNITRQVFIDYDNTPRFHNVYRGNCTFFSPNYVNDGCSPPHGRGLQHYDRIDCIGNNCPYNGPHTDTRVDHWTTVTIGQAFMDINEVPLYGSSISSTANFTSNNIVLPNYDNFNVQAQGLSGTMSSPIYKSGVLFGLSGNENNQGFSLGYSINGTSTVPDYARFNEKPNFYLENELSTYINVLAASHNTTSTNTNILEYYVMGSVDLLSKPRRKTSTFIEYYNNDEIINNITVLKQNGFLQANESGFERASMPKKSIGAYKITAVDGKTYHYSLPVYNHEIITRSFGAVADKSEDQSYMEKRQLEPYATHWLLTAVTGPDFVDNGDGVAGDGDLGYWVSFEYGKWTDAFVWKAPYKKDYIYDDNNPSIKTWIRGRKQLYYLDKVKTRTHTALFVKSRRTDSPSENWIYNSVNHVNGSSGDYSHQFTVPSQNQLRLDKIILLKRLDDTIGKDYGPDSNSSITVGYNNSDKPSENAKYDIYDNVIDSQDNWQGLISKALKVIDFTYQPSLGGENSLVLQSVDYKGKSGNAVLPPYKFNYYAGNYGSSYKFDRNDGWGYYADDPKDLSLSKITTPQGGTINVEYEGNRCKSLVPNKLEFSNMNKARFKCTLPTYANSSDISNKSVIIDIGSQNSFPNLLNKTVNISLIIDWVCFNDLFYSYIYNGLGVISEDLGGGKYRVSFNENVSYGLGPSHHNSGEVACNMDNVNHAIASAGNDYRYHQIKVTVDLTSNDVYTSGGIRVKNIKVTDGVQNYVTEYKYGQNEDGIGYVSYVPFAQYIAKEVPYSSELPAPRVMYEYVSVSSHGASVPAESKIQYKFNIMKEKDPYLVKYGDFYQITSAENYHTNTIANKAVCVGAYTIKDNLASIGQLLEVKTFNGKGHLLSKITNNYYKTTDVIPNNMGITQESYQSYKTVDYTNESTRDKWLINSSTRIKYPNIIKSSTEQKDGYTYKTDFQDYDLISGVAKETQSISSDGKSLKTRIVPAYTIIPYATMGSKVDNINNKNMLSQTAAEYSYILDAGVWKETGVGITTWNNVWAYKDMAGDTSNPANEVGVWRKHKSFIWNGVVDSNGIFTNYNSATDDGFDWAVGVGQPTGTKWKQTSEVTLYDHYSAPLEMKDINGNKASTKMGDNDSKIMATGNAGYNEMFYAGAENSMHNYWLEPEVRMVNAARDQTYYHTGKYSVATTSSSELGVFMRGGQHRAGRYKLSVWVKKDNESKARVRYYNNTITSTFNGESYYAGDWVLKTHYFDATTGDTYPYVNSVDGSTVYYDDLMIRPIASSITGYVYNQWDELSYIIGNNGLATHFEYDDAGRLTKTSVEVLDDAANGLTGGFKLKSVNKIKYKNLLP